MTILHTVACYRLKACAKQRALVSITLAFHLRSAFPETKQMFQHFPGAEILHSGNVHPLHAWSCCSLQIKCCSIKGRRPVKMPDFILQWKPNKFTEFLPSSHSTFSVKPVVRAYVENNFIFFRRHCALWKLYFTHKYMYICVYFFPTKLDTLYGRGHRHHCILQKNKK